MEVDEEQKLQFEKLRPFGIQIEDEGIKKDKEAERGSKLEQSKPGAPLSKPVTGSQVSNSAPQIIQLFFTGVAILSRPLNISALLQWLYAPIHPLPFRFRQQLAECLALNGGCYAMEGDDRA